MFGTASPSPACTTSFDMEGKWGVSRVNDTTTHPTMCKHLGCAHAASMRQGQNGALRQAARRHATSYYIHIEHIMCGGCDYCERLVRRRIWPPLHIVRERLDDLASARPGHYRALCAKERSNAAAMEGE